MKSLASRVDFHCIPVVLFFFHLKNYPTPSEEVIKVSWLNEEFEGHSKTGENKSYHQAI